MMIAPGLRKAALVFEALSIVSPRPALTWGLPASRWRSGSGMRISPAPAFAAIRAAYTTHEGGVTAASRELNDDGGDALGHHLAGRDQREALLIT